MRGVLSLVALSVDEFPRSEAVAKSGACGAAGTTDNEPVPLDAEYVVLSDGVKLPPTENWPEDNVVYAKVAL
jgi:hypothetical protein